MIRILLFALISIFVFGCGPEKSADDQLDDQRDTQEKLERNELQQKADARLPVIERAVGQYDGKYVIDGQTVRVILDLYYIEVVTQIRNSSETFNMPSLRGSLRSRNESSVASRLELFEFIENLEEIRMKNATGTTQLDFQVLPNGNLDSRFFNGPASVDAEITFTRQP